MASTDGRLGSNIINTNLETITHLKPKIKKIKTRSSKSLFTNACRIYLSSYFFVPINTSLPEADIFPYIYGSVINDNEQLFSESESAMQGLRNIESTVNQGMPKTISCLESLTEQELYQCKHISENDDVIDAKLPFFGWWSSFMKLQFASLFKPGYFKQTIATMLFNEAFSYVPGLSFHEVHRLAILKCADHRCNTTRHAIEAELDALNQDYSQPFLSNLQSQSESSFKVGKKIAGKYEKMSFTKMVKFYNSESQGNANMTYNMHLPNILNTNEEFDDFDGFENTELNLPDEQRSDFFVAAKLAFIYHLHHHYLFAAPDAFTIGGIFSAPTNKEPADILEEIRLIGFDMNKETEEKMIDNFLQRGRYMKLRNLNQLKSMVHVQGKKWILGDGFIYEDLVKNLVQKEFVEKMGYDATEERMDSLRTFKKSIEDFKNMYELLEMRRSGKLLNYVITCCTIIAICVLLTIYYCCAFKRCIRKIKNKINPEETKSQLEVRLKTNFDVELDDEQHQHEKEMEEICMDYLTEINETETTHNDEKAKWKNELEDLHKELSEMASNLEFTRKEKEKKEAKNKSLSNELDDIKRNILPQVYQEASKILQHTRKLDVLDSVSSTSLARKSISVTSTNLSIYSKTSLTNASLTKIPDSTITNNQSNLKLLPSSLLCALPESTIVQQTSVFSSDLTGLPESMIDVDAENVLEYLQNSTLEVYKLRKNYKQKQKHLNNLSQKIDLSQKSSSQLTDMIQDLTSKLNVKSLKVKNLDEKAKKLTVKLEHEISSHEKTTADMKEQFLKESLENNRSKLSELDAQLSAFNNEKEVHEKTLLELKNVMEQKDLEIKFIATEMEGKLHDEVEKRESELRKLTQRIKDFDAKCNTGDLQTSKLQNELDKRDRQIKAMILKAEKELSDTDEKFIYLERRKNEEMKAAVEVKEAMIEEMQVKMQIEIEKAEETMKEEMQENCRLRGELNEVNKKVEGLQTQTSITSFQAGQLRNSVLRRDDIIEKLRKNSDTEINRKNKEFEKLQHKMEEELQNTINEKNVMLETVTRNLKVKFKEEKEQEISRMKLEMGELQSRSNTEAHDEIRELQSQLSLALEERRFAKRNLNQLKSEYEQKCEFLEKTTYELEQLEGKKQEIEQQVEILNNRMTSSGALVDKQQEEQNSKMQKLHEQNAEFEGQVLNLNRELHSKSDELKLLHEQVLTRTQDMKKFKSLNLTHKTKMLALGVRIEAKDKRLNQQHEEIQLRIDQNKRERVRHKDLVEQMRVKLREKQDELGNVAEQMSQWKVATAIDLACELKDKIRLEIQNRQAFYETPIASAISLLENRKESSFKLPRL